MQSPGLRYFSSATVHGASRGKVQQNDNRLF
jgi:hypothetical protein